MLGKQFGFRAVALSALLLPAAIAFGAVPAYAAGSCSGVYIEGGHAWETANCSGFSNGTKIRAVALCHSPSGTTTAYGEWVSPQFHSIAECGSGAYASSYNGGYQHNP